MTSNNMPLITAEDIDELHNNFIVFGNPKSSFWFLGLEEGDHPPRDMDIDTFIHGLLEKTNKFKKSSIISLRDLCAPKDGYEFLPKIEPDKPETASDTKYQSTWGGYIKLLLSISSKHSGNDWTLNDVKLYQKYRLGSLDIREDGLGSCLLELFPMARKGRKYGQWPYGKLQGRKGLNHFSTPDDYRLKVEDSRTQLFLDLLDEHKPQFLCVFGQDCKNVISEALDTKIDLLEIDQGNRSLSVSVTKRGKTLIVFSTHPTAHGISNLYWRNLGTEIAKLKNK